jgi:hypothetical protein
MLVVAPHLAQGVTPAPPHDYSKETENGEYVLVMLGDPRLATPVRQKYNRAGLYRNDGSNEPLWTVDFWERRAIPCSDGEHMIVLRPSFYSRGAVSFYRNGHEQKRYMIEELVKDKSRLTSICGILDWLHKAEYSERRGTLLIRTRDGETYVFSATTGEKLPFWRWAVLRLQPGRRGK